MKNKSRYGCSNTSLKGVWFVSLIGKQPARDKFENLYAGSSLRFHIYFIYFSFFTVVLLFVFTFSVFLFKTFFCVYHTLKNESETMRMENIIIE